MIQRFESMLIVVRVGEWLEVQSESDDGQNRGGTSPELSAPVSIANICKSQTRRVVGLGVRYLVHDGGLRSAPVCCS